MPLGGVRLCADLDSEEFRNSLEHRGGDQERSFDGLRQLGGKASELSFLVND